MNVISIGDYVTVGMGCVVTKSIDSGLTVIGNPAHPKYNFYSYSSKLLSSPVFQTSA